jgi:hypothetical protein
MMVKNNKLVVVLPYHSTYPTQLGILACFSHKVQCVLKSVVEILTGIPLLPLKHAANAYGLTEPFSLAA